MEMAKRKKSMKKNQNRNKEKRSYGGAGEWVRMVSWVRAASRMSTFIAASIFLSPPSPPSPAAALMSSPSPLAGGFSAGEGAARAGRDCQQLEWSDQTSSNFPGKKTAKLDFKRTMAEFPTSPITRTLHRLSTPLPVLRGRIATYC